MLKCDLFRPTFWAEPARVFVCVCARAAETYELSALSAEPCWNLTASE